MSNRLTIATAALLLASATPGMAQTEQKSPSPPSTVRAGSIWSAGSVDFGFRAGSTTGDRARYERYRDLRNGANVNLTYEKATRTSYFSVKGTNIGYQDQNLSARFVNNRIRLYAFFDQTPLNYGLDGLMRTPWTEGPAGVWTLPDAAQEAVQNKTAVGVLCAPGLAAGAVCTPATAGLALSQESIYRGLAQPFDLKSRRDTLGVELTYSAAKEVDVEASFKSTGRTGYRPFGMSFAFSNANELPLPMDDRNNEFSMGLRFGDDQRMVRVAYERAMYSQHVSSVTWDNPVRLTDYNDGQAIDPLTGNGPWDPSAYSNGNGAARGRLPLPPSNTFDMLSVMGTAKLPSHSNLNGSVAFTTAKQNEAFIPWTTNPVIANAATYVQYPGLASFPRNSAEASVDGLNATINFTSRPLPSVGLALRYRYNDHKNRTPVADFGNTVRFDGVPEPGPYATEAHNYSRSTFNADATFTPIPYTALKVGVGRDTYEHSPRGYEALTDSSVRASVDTVGNQWVSLRAILERSRRLATGFNEEAITGPGGQERSRMFDDAERSRDRGTLLVTLTPAKALDFTVSYARGRDRYDSHEQYFGLLDNTNTSYNVGVNVTPTDTIAFGANYGQEQFSSFQRSRTANPLTSVAGAYQSWTDTNRDWMLDNDEKVNSFDLYFDLLNALPKTDIRVAYTLSDSDNAFVHSGPRITAMRSNLILTPGDSAPCSGGVSSCFEALPNVTNKWQRATVDVRHFFTDRIGIGAEYWYEKLDVSDFATINLPGTDTPRIDYLGSLTTGYGTRPYTGSTGFVRLLVKF